MSSLFNQSSIPPDLQLLALLGSGGLLVLVVALIRSGKLKEGYSIIWFLIGIAMVLFAVLPGLLDVFAGFLAISYKPAALFVVLIGGLFLLSIKYSVLASKHDKRIRELAQEHAILQAQIERRIRHYVHD